MPDVCGRDAVRREYAAVALGEVRARTAEGRGRLVLVLVPLIVLDGEGKEGDLPLAGRRPALGRADVEAAAAAEEDEEEDPMRNVESGAWMWA